MTGQPRVVTAIVGAGVLAIAAAFAIAGSAGLGASGATVGGSAERAPADTAVSAATLTLSSGMAKQSTGDDLLTTASVIVTVSARTPTWQRISAMSRDSLPRTMVKKPSRPSKPVGPSTMGWRRTTRPSSLRRRNSSAVQRRSLWLRTLTTRRPG